MCAVGAPPCPYVPCRKSPRSAGRPCRGDALEAGSRGAHGRSGAGVNWSSAAPQCQCQLPVWPVVSVLPLEKARGAVNRRWAPPQWSDFESTARPARHTATPLYSVACRGRAVPPGPPACVMSHVRFMRSQGEGGETQHSKQQLARGPSRPHGSRQDAPGDWPRGRQLLHRVDCAQTADGDVGLKRGLLVVAQQLARRRQRLREPAQRVCVLVVAVL